MKTFQQKTVIAMCLLMLLSGINVKAQDGKPSKEETIEFINKFLQSQNNNELTCKIYRKRYDAYYITKFINREAEVINSSLFLEHTREEDWIGKKSQYFSPIVKLSNVEEIQIVGLGIKDDDGGGGCMQYGMYFKEKGKEDWQENSHYLPLWRGGLGEDKNKYKETQIYKAFEHLRKLLGAPEPLKF